MTRLQGVAGGLPDSGSSPRGGERAAFHFSRLPPGTPETILKNTIIVNDSTRTLSWNKEERQRNFNVLVKRYKNQILYGCKEPNCLTPTCLSFRRRASEAPFRNFTELSARTLACHLASQDDPERGLCRNAPATNSEYFPQDITRWAPEKHPSPLYHGSRTGTDNPHRERKSGVKPVACRPRRRSKDYSVPANGHSMPGQGQPHEASRTKNLKDPKSITQNLFDTLSVRMVEWLPLRKAAYEHHQTADNKEGLGPQPLPNPDVPRDPARRGEQLKARRKVLADEQLLSNTSSISTTPSTSSPPALEVRVAASTVKNLPLGEIDHWKHTGRSVSDSTLKAERKPARRKLATTNTPTTNSKSFPSPPPPRQRPEKRLHNETRFSEFGQAYTRPLSSDKSSTDYVHHQGSEPRSPWEIPSPSGNGPSGAESYWQPQLGPEGEPKVESLSILSKNIVDGLETMMFETEEDEKRWKDELTLLELRGFSEQWKWQFATPLQRQMFPFISQSLYYVFSNPQQLLQSFRSDAEGSVDTGEMNAVTNLDKNNIESIFRKIYRISPWETTLNSLWMCLEKLFIPPKEFSTSSKNHRRFIWRSTSGSTSRGDAGRDEPFAHENHISNTDAASIAAIALFALASSIPPLDTETWQIMQRSRSAGNVLPDFEIRKSSKVTTDLLVEAADKFEHDLALRLVNRLARVVSARLGFYELSKLKTSMQDVRGPGNSNPMDLVIKCIQPYVVTKSATWRQGIPEPERRTNMPTVAVEWLKSLLLKEWDGEPEILKSSAAGGALQLLSSMYQHKAKLGLAPEDFHTRFLFERLDPLEMPVEWLAFVSNNRTMHLLSCPFMFLPSALVGYFRALNYSSMSKSYEAAVTTTRHMTQTAFSNSITIDDDIGLLARLKTSLSKYLVLVIRRESPLIDALDQLWRREKRELMRPLRVQMGMDEGEEGIDHGGVQQEFFRVVMAEILDPAFGMFTMEAQSHMSWFQPCSFEPLYKFELIGLLVSLAVYNGLTLPVNFPVALYMKLLDFKVKKLDHIINGWEDLTRGLGELLSWSDGDVGDVFMRTYEFSFDAFGKVVTVDMTKVDRSDPWPSTERNVTWNKTRLRSFATSSDNGDPENRDCDPSVQDTSGGSSSSRGHGNLSGILKGYSSKPREQRVPSPPPHEAPLVTNTNREQFVKDYIFWLTDKSVRPQYEAFARGFYTCLDRMALSIFTPEALKTVVEGIQEIDIDELQRHTRYEGFEPDNPLIRGFWRIVKDYSHEKKRQLLEFVTASDRVPVNGISSIVFVVMRNGDSDDRLPTSSTCFGRLLLPEYSSLQVLEEKLDKALENCKGFGVA